MLAVHVHVNSSWRKSVQWYSLQHFRFMTLCQQLRLGKCSLLYLSLSLILIYFVYLIDNGCENGSVLWSSVSWIADFNIVWHREAQWQVECPSCPNYLTANAIWPDQFLRWIKLARLNAAMCSTMVARIRIAGQHIAYFSFGQSPLCEQWVCALIHQVLLRYYCLCWYFWR